jgi:peptidoglycan hydrolase-like protein with peptidoglycan-binding domain
MRTRCGLALVLFLLAAPQVASAAAGPKLSIKPEQLSGHNTTFVGSPWRVRVVMRPFVAGEAVAVRFFRRGHRIGVALVTLAPTPDGGAGFALVPFATRKAGRVEVRATSVPTAVLGALKARRVRVSVQTLHAVPGQRGPVVRVLQRALGSLGYVVGRRGFYDDRTARAVLAFRKVTGMARTTIASADVFRRLARGVGRFRVRHPDHAKHVEADLSRQVLALIRGNRVERIYPMSSGKPSTPTVIGTFRVYSKTTGFNAKGMYFSNYFIRGYAIHGYADVPVFAASHGCLRVPIPDAVSIFRWLRIGDIVDVYP